MLKLLHKLLCRCGLNLIQGLPQSPDNRFQGVMVRKSLIRDFQTVSMSFVCIYVES